LQSFLFDRIVSWEIAVKSESRYSHNGSLPDYFFVESNAMPRVKSKSGTSFIAPDYLYTRQGFIEASGISPSRMREARLYGISPKWLDVGRRKFILGRDAIEYILQLSERKFDEA
jgi:hypothetical protein